MCKKFLEIHFFQGCCGLFCILILTVCNQTEIPEVQKLFFFSFLQQDIRVYCATLKLDGDQNSISHFTVSQLSRHCKQKE